jgi:hypothetical protein
MADARLSAISGPGRRGAQRRSATSAPVFRNPRRPRSR